MENKDLMKMLQIYKTKLADAEEKVIALQVVVSNDIAEKEELQQTISNLENQINELTASVPTEG